MSKILTFERPQALFSDHLKQIERLVGAHDGADAVTLALRYQDLVSHPSFHGTVFELSPDFDWQDENTLEQFGLWLQESDDIHSHTGGEETDDNEHLEVAAVREEIQEEFRVQVRTVGSGVLVSSRVMLTAAHIFADHDPSRVSVRQFGDLEIEGTPITPDPQEGPDPPEQDIAAVVLRNPPEDLPIVPIAENGSYTKDDTFRSIGYGSMVGNPPPTVAILNHAHGISVMSLDCTGLGDASRYACQAERHIVAGTYNLTACTNDSGGALLVQKGVAWELVGIVGSGIEEGCTTAVRYARVTAYRNELNAKLQARGYEPF